LQARSQKWPIKGRLHKTNKKLKDQKNLGKGRTQDFRHLTMKKNGPENKTWSLQRRGSREGEKRNEA